MMQQTLLMCLTNSQVHVGAGHAMDTIDLPIQRERMSGWPYIPGTGLKGVLRDHYLDKNALDVCFGSGADQSSSAGAVGFPDLNLLGFPVRCLQKGFVLITSPLVLQRLARNLKRMDGFEDLKKTLGQLPQSLEQDTVFGAEKADLCLEEFQLSVQKSGFVNDLIMNLDVLLEDYESISLDSLMVVSDRLFQFFVQHSTEVQARIAIDDETGTAQQGALFYEEYLPSDTLLYGVLSMESGRSGDLTLKEFCQEIPEFVQIGGGATTGKGIVQLMFLEGAADV